MGALLYSSYALIALVEAATLFAPVPMAAQMILLASMTAFIGCLLAMSQEVTETLEHGDALQFPLLAAGMLGALFVAFKYLSAYWINALLSVYFCAVGLATVTQLCAPLVRPLLPPSRRDKLVLDVRPPMLERVTLTLTDAICVIPAAAVCVAYGLTKHYVCNNILGISFAVEGIKRVSLGKYSIGALLLGALFVYDCVMVFGTPLMVTVATKLDGPIKLLFPRGQPDLVTGKTAFSLLGLGAFAALSRTTLLTQNIILCCCSRHLACCSRRKRLIAC